MTCFFNSNWNRTWYRYEIISSFTKKLLFILFVLWVQVCLMHNTVHTQELGTAEFQDYRQLFWWTLQRADVCSFPVFNRESRRNYQSPPSSQRPQHTEVLWVWTQTLISPCVLYLCSIRGYEVTFESRTLWHHIWKIPVGCLDSGSELSWLRKTGLKRTPAC